MASWNRPPARRLAGLLAPPLCVCCRRPLPRPASGAGLCGGCGAEIARAPSLILSADAIDAGFAALPYGGAGRRLVGALKFSRLLIAAELGAALIGARAPWRLPAAIVPVPAAPLRLAARGFDPAAELARALAGSAGAEVAAVLRRRDLRRQRGRARGERIADPPAIAAVAAPPEVLLIDDVVTTGATLDACAVALRGAGCEVVLAAALAAVPPPRSSLARARHGGVALRRPRPLPSERRDRADRDRRT